jgi:hypothetical protein
MGEDPESDHFEVMEDAHHAVKGIVISRLSDPFPEVGEGSFGGNIFKDAGIIPIVFTPALISNHLQEGVHIPVVVNIAEQVQEKEGWRIIAGWAEDAVRVSHNRPDISEIDQRGDHPGIAALDVPIGFYTHETFLKDVLRQEVGLRERFLMGGGKILVDLV